MKYPRLESLAKHITEEIPKLGYTVRRTTVHRTSIHIELTPTITLNLNDTDGYCKATIEEFTSTGGEDGFMTELATIETSYSLASSIIVHACRTVLEEIKQIPRAELIVNGG